MWLTYKWFKTGPELKFLCYKQVEKNNMIYTVDGEGG